MSLLINIHDTTSVINNNNTKSIHSNNDVHDNIFNKISNVPNNHHHRNSTRNNSPPETKLPSSSGLDNDNNNNNQVINSSNTESSLFLSIDEAIGTSFSLQLNISIYKPQQFFLQTNFYLNECIFSFEDMKTSVSINSQSMLLLFSSYGVMYIATFGSSLRFGLIVYSNTS
jgi:hypothetical protein